MKTVDVMTRVVIKVCIKAWQKEKKKTRKNREAEKKRMCYLHPSQFDLYFSRRDFIRNEAETQQAFWSPNEYKPEQEQEKKTSRKMCFAFHALPFRLQTKRKMYQSFFDSQALSRSVAR